MAKKVKRQTRRSEESPVLSTATNSNTRSFEREFNPDYSPVIKDLKRIAALASTFFVILIALSFFLR